MKIREGFIIREVAGNYVVVPIGETTLDFNGMMNLNSTGAFLFQKMLTGTTRQELINSLISEYDIDEKTASADVDVFIEKVKGENLFE